MAKTKPVVTKTKLPVVSKQDWRFWRLLSWPLLKFDIRANIFFWSILTILMSFYICEIGLLYDPNAMSAMEELLAMYPAEMMQAFGLNDMGSNLVQLLAGTFYGMLVFVVPMIYYINAANRLVAKLVDSGAMVYLLQTPLSRVKVIFTQAFFLLSSLLAMFTVVFVVIWLLCSSKYPGQLDTPALFQLHLTTFLLCALMASVCFFYSCYFNESRLALALGAGIPVGLLLMQMLGGTGDDLQIFKDLSIFAIVDPRSVVDNGNTLMINVVFVVLTALFINLSAWVFKRKQLPI